VDTGAAIRRAREEAGLSQSELAQRARTSQTAISAYESGRKKPSVATLSRILSAAGVRLSVEPARKTGAERMAENGRRLLDVLALAEALPSRHERTLRYPPLTPRTG
jgi:transcriptional regulator with XRE-family HTH domain